MICVRLDDRLWLGLFLHRRLTTFPSRLRLHSIPHPAYIFTHTQYPETTAMDAYFDFIT